MIFFSKDSIELAIETEFETHQDEFRDGFENLGSLSNVYKTLSSDASSHFINGQAGNDLIRLMGTGSDMIHSGSGSDGIVSGNGKDTVYAGSGDDSVVAGKGMDLVYGGSGNDTLSGGAGRDVIFGGSGLDVLRGDEGSDTLYGGLGNDVLVGGANADTLYGGSGADHFVFEKASDLGLAKTDLIADFSRLDGDRIDLSGIDANRMVFGDQAFVWRDGPHGRAGSIWLGDAVDGKQTVYINLDGGKADIAIEVAFDDAAMTTLTASDFIL